MSECSFYISQQLIDIKNYRWCFLKPSQYYTEGYKHKRKLVTEASNVSFHSGNVSGNYSLGKLFLERNFNYDICCHDQNPSGCSSTKIYKWFYIIMTFMWLIFN